MLELIRDDDPILLPSLPSSSTLGPDFAAALLNRQLVLLQNSGDMIEPSRVIVRIPPQVKHELLDSIVPRFDELGVRGAAFVFNGELGPNDRDSLALRSRLPRNWLTLALGRIEPYAIPVFYYLGLDLIDAGRALGAAAQGIRLWPRGYESIPHSEEIRYCSCHACSSQTNLADIDREALQTVLVAHNMGLCRTFLSESVNAAHLGQLRSLVESMTHSSPASAAFLRTVDKELYTFTEEFTNTTGSGALPLIGPESYNSPVVRRFREYVASRYVPPSYKKLILILPCSARKPYSDSKSHKLFREVTDAGLGASRFAVAETILTSPLGVIPRELERSYPASFYDLPVTGDWDAEETAIAADALSVHLAKFDKSAVVIAHVSGGYEDAVKAAESRIQQSIIYTTSGQPATSRESLESLGETLKELVDVLSLKSGRSLENKEILRATADFQFGSGSGEVLIPENASVWGKPYGMIVSRIEKEQTCAYVAASGALSLTLVGGRLVAPLERYWVRFDGRRIKGGSVFAVGVLDADPKIRPGDEVIVIGTDDEVIGVGRSEMSGIEMCEFEKGCAVSVRHKVD
ncbi:MAG: hypothetical protein C4K47_05900 [Candidatus Thorarchaeota archaeon]|nr:MAG: hypothetical protein C4K47_05900 [Candidatus Thorarchaeota archaeon]